MKKYIVSGKTTAFISVEIEAESKEEAIKKAYEECSFVSNSGWDKLIRTSIVCDNEVEYTQAEEIN